MNDAVIVVTGASGFIGRTIIRLLSARQFKVLAVSRKAVSATYAQWVRVDDYRNTPNPGAAVLIHLAEEATIATANARGEAHVTAVHEVVTHLVGKNFLNVVYASSGQIYRTSTFSDAYTTAKLDAETIVLDAGGSVARLGNVYGPGMRHHTLIGDIVRQIPGEGPLRIRNAAPRRDFLWVEDAAEALIKVALGTTSGIFDVGSGQLVSAGEIARLALAAAGEQHRPVVAEDGSAAEDTITLDIRPLQTTFGWSPKVTLSEGITRLLRAAA